MDLKLADPLAHLNYFEMIDPKNDHLLMPVLEEMGWDIQYPIQIDACQHRTLGNKVVVNYLISGEININRKHLNGPWATALDKILAAQVTDSSLAKELLEMSGTQVSYSTLHSSDSNENKEIQNILDHYMDVDETERITAQIKQLEDILFTIRGDQRLSSGAYKLAEDYHKEEILPRPRKKKVKKVKEI